MKPILFQWGPISIYAYGLFLALGFMAAVSWGMRRARSAGIPADSIQTLGIAALVGGLIGARGLYILLNHEFFLAQPLEIFRLDHGGLIFYGGLLGGAAAVFWMIRRFRLPLGRTVDLLTPPLILAHAIGRVGCFMNGCCYGDPTDLPWGVRFFAQDLTRHPTQLYEFFFLLALSVGLLRWERRRHAPGSVFLLYGCWYGIWRFGNEFLRGDSPILSWGLTPFQWMSIPLVLLCGVFLVRRERSYSTSNS